MRRRSNSSRTVAGAAAVGMALVGLLRLHGHVHTAALLPGAEAFLLPSRGVGGGRCVSGSGRIVTGARAAITAPSTTRRYHSPDASAAPATAAGPQTDEAVPEGHKGLHSYLYGEGGAEGAHSSSSGGSGGGSGYVQFTRGTLHEVEEWLARYDSSAGQPKVAGVYGVYDDFGGLRFIGVSRDVGLALRAHQKVQGRKAVARVAVQSFRFPKREDLGNYQAMWLAELAAAPEGNVGEGWAASIKEAVEAGAADAARRAAYEESKVKLRAAMADPTLRDELEDLDESDEDDPEEAAAKREALRRAAGGDWSAAVDAQTQATVDSPFEKGQGAAAVLPSGEAALELTPANVDKVLDEVRPYLISDGGNIEVVRVEVETRNIFLRLQGACGSCPSSTVTMKMGVERVLREKFADLGIVEAISPEAEPPTGADGAPLSEQEALRQKIEQKLGEILPAIRGLGASAAVEGVGADGVVTLSFQGPDKVRLGVVYALKSLPGVMDVKSV